MKRILLIPLMLAWACFAHAEERVALVIGNGAYQDAPLRNPPNDARAMAQALRECGFEVIERTDSDQQTMFNAIRAFGKKIQRGGVGLFYYAGHGMQVKDSNYLIPIGADVQAEDEVRFQAINAGMVLSKMETAGNRLNIIILDACRDNPFARSFRSGSRGLKKMDAPTGSLLAYATAPGDVAADGTEMNGLYTSMLLKHMRQPGVSVMDVFMRVRRDVKTAAGGSQVPWESTSLTEPFYFVPEDATAPAIAPPPIAPPPPAAVTFGHLQVNVNAQNSQVYVDGKFRGMANPGKPLNLININLGQVAVRVTASGYEEQTQHFTLKANEWTQAVVELELVVMAPPAGVANSPKPVAAFLHLTSKEAIDHLTAENECPGCDLSGADLIREDLENADLRGANLTRTILFMAKLGNANLNGAILVEANLLHADLREATLIKADLTKARVIGAKLQGADLTGAKLSDAKLQGADLTNATWIDGKKCYRGSIGRCKNRPSQ